MALRERIPWKNLRLALVWIIVLGAVGLITYWAIWANDSPWWTGFGQHRNEQGQLVRAKTLWDWLDLLIVPIVLAAGAWWLNRTEKRTELEAARRRAAAEMEAARDKQNHEILQHYFDKMSDLLMSTDLGALAVEEADSETCERAKVAVAIARTRTLTVLRAVDVGRVSAVFRFLQDTTLGDKRLDEIVSLADGDLRRVEWKEANLVGANLQGAVLWMANLRDAYLEMANMQDAYLALANLQGAKLLQANLQGAKLAGANLRAAHLWWANLQGANLVGANLQGAKLFEANLQGAKLAGANLLEAELWEANLEGAELWSDPLILGISESKTQVTPKQLLEAKSLKGATMPDGNKYEEWVERGKPDWTRQAEDDDVP